jgi:hypothetical protein
MPKKLTQAEFLAKAVAVHGVCRYDYSQTVYAGSVGKVKIGCPTHGVFEQFATSHLAGCGCSACAYSKRPKGYKKQTYTLESFIKKAREKHGFDTYDYSQTIYQPNPRKVNIICPRHGVFMIPAGSHISGQGCMQCARVNSGIRRCKRKEIVIALFWQIHGNCYDYSELPEVFTAREALPIRCTIHGIFMQPHYTHISGGGCPRCADAANGLRRRNTKEAFITKARTLYKDKYDYSQVVYKRGHQKVTILCPKHGPFQQEPFSHTAKKAPAGCPKCSAQARAQEWAERYDGQSCTLYLLRFFSGDEEFFKVGVTTLSISHRYSHGGKRGGYNYELLAQHTSTNAIRISEWEQSILDSFAHLHYKPKRPFQGQTECFSSADEILAIFPL